MAAQQRYLVLLVFAGAALAAAVLIGASLATRGGDDPAVEAAAAPALLAVAQTNALLRGIPQDGIALGRPDAPVTIEEYADLQCPYCAEWARGAFPAVVDEYVRSGDVRIVFRGLAFIGPESELALRTALAAGAQDKLWNIVHLLYENQGGENEGWVTEGLLREVALAVRGLDVDAMLGARNTPVVDDELAAAQHAAQAAAVPGTPAFLIGPTGGTLEPLALTSLDAEPIRARVDALLAR